MGKKKRKLMTDSVTVRKEETARGENRKQRSFISSTHFPSAIAFFGSVFSSAIPPHSHLSLPYKYLPSPCSLTCMHLPLRPFYLSPPHPLTYLPLLPPSSPPPYLPPHHPLTFLLPTHLRTSLLTTPLPSSSPPTYVPPSSPPPYLPPPHPLTYLPPHHPLTFLLPTHLRTSLLTTPLPPSSPPPYLPPPHPLTYLPPHHPLTFLLPTHLRTSLLPTHLRTSLLPTHVPPSSPLLPLSPPSPHLPLSLPLFSFFASLVPPLPPPSETNSSLYSILAEQATPITPVHIQQVQFVSIPTPKIYRLLVKIWGGQLYISELLAVDTHTVYAYMYMYMYLLDVPKQQTRMKHAF